MTGKLIIFWDYDTQWGAEQSRSLGGAKTWGYLDFLNTERLLQLHDAYQIPACFAIVGEAALPGTRPYHDPDQIRQIYSDGHEVASHSMRHEWLPGLGYQKLVQTLRDSKDALEQCISAPVVTFVPPFNQPSDFQDRLSISLSERRSVPSDRIDLRRLCDALSETGYLFCRVSYSTILERLTTLLGRERPRTVKLEKIGRVSCLRLSCRGGFKDDALKVIEPDLLNDGIAAIYGHPHSLYSGNAQDEQYLTPFLERVRGLVDKGTLQVVLPRDLV